MNPTQQPPSAEAVKAAFSMADLAPIKHAPEGFPEAFEAIRPFIVKGEDCVECAARILAAHARAREAEVERLREALKNIYNGTAFDVPSMPQAALEALPGVINEIADKALTGESSASDDGWKPIGTAPKDRLIDIWSSVERIANCLWMSKDGDSPCYYSRFGNGDPYRNATHWREIPQGPKP